MKGWSEDAVESPQEWIRMLCSDNVIIRLNMTMLISVRSINVKGTTASTVRVCCSVY